MTAHKQLPDWYLDLQHRLERLERTLDFHHKAFNQLSHNQRALVKELTNAGLLNEDAGEVDVEKDFLSSVPGKLSS